MRRGLWVGDGLEVVETRSGKAALISGNSLGFEVDAITRDVLSLCDGRSADEIVNTLKGRYGEEEVREALGELQSLKAIEVGSLRRFLFSKLSSLADLAVSPFQKAFWWAIRGHGDGILGQLRGDDVQDILLLTLSDDPSTLRIPAALLRERFPRAHLLIWRSAGARGVVRDLRALRQAAFDLTVGVYGFSGRGLHRRFALTWLFGRLARARQRVVYVDAYDFLPRAALFHLLSAWASFKGRCAGALQRAALRGYAACAEFLRPPIPSPPSPRRILVLAPGGIGDIVLSTPALRALRRQHPDAHLACVVPSGSEGVLRTCPFVDEVIPSPVRGRGGLRDLLRRFGFARVIRSRRFDLAVTLRHWPGQACDGYLPYLAGIPRRVGPSFPGSREGARLFTHPVRVTATHQADAALEVVRGAGEDRTLFLGTTDADRASVAAYLAEGGIGAEDLIVGIHPGSSAEVKQWPPERFAEMANRLALRWGARVVLTGGPGEVQLAWEVARHTATAPLIAAGNLSLSQSIALIARCDLFLCGDSGPMHIAAAVGTPVVALFGPTDPARWGPRTPDSLIVRRRVFCGPRPACSVGPYPACPRGNPVCMNTISSEEVLRSAEALLEGRFEEVSRSPLQEE